MLTVRLDSPIPLADQIASGLRCAIAMGKIRVEDPLPTVRQLAADLGINMNTVARAYRALESDGLVRSRRGRGTLVSGNRSRVAATDPKVMAELTGRLRESLAELRLAGVNEEAARALVAAQFDELWSEEK